MRNCRLAALLALALIAGPALAQPAPAPKVAGPTEVAQPQDGGATAPAEPAVPGTEAAKDVVVNFGTVLRRDFEHLVTAPAHWGTRDWEIFSAGTLGVVAVGALADRSVRDSQARMHSATADRIASDFEMFGSTVSFGILAAFYAGGALAGDERAEYVAEDGVIASLLSQVVVIPLKYAAGRRRPRDTKATFDFAPFSNNASFPSGHAVQAFLVASVIGVHYPSPWVQVAVYVPAALVGYARVHHQAHFVSDVTAGALIGTALGRSLTHFNQHLRGKVAFVPLATPQGNGMAVVLDF
ncbi:MAG TPA: phosphatase PAP2 family protein [Thermoanaerobaculia bacterium]|nr:phosphatase PAP2 family protein [Thermoanaerobaculia bacterium]